MQIHTPEWVKDAIVYEIFPDRFHRSQRAKHGFLLSSIELERWEKLPTFWSYKGGDLWGIAERINDLKDLGVNVLYLTPIFQSASCHRYHTDDYYVVDPLLGGNQAFEHFLKVAHQNSMRVVLDGVFNHCGRGFYPFHHVAENNECSPWKDWFTIHAFPIAPYHSKQPNYACWNNDPALPAFNHENLAVREYLMQVAEHWIKLGIDGWRLDVPFEIKVPGFWQEFRQRVKAINPEAYIVGEIWGDASEWLDGTQFDGVMNYQFAAPTIAFVAGDRVVQDYANPFCQTSPPLDAPAYASKIEALLKLYPWDIQLTQFNLLDSHDTARLITLAGGDKASVALATLLLFTFPGAPCIYYGDEVGLEGGPDPDCRRGFPAEVHWDQKVLAYHRQLIALRHAHPALRTGDYQFLLAQGSVYVFARILGTEELIVALNVGTEAAIVSVASQGMRLPAGIRATLHSRPDRLLYGTGTAEWVGEGSASRLTLSLPPRTGIVICDTAA